MHPRKRIVIISAISIVIGIVVLKAWLLTYKPDLAKPVAAVNGVEITLKELKREVKKARDNLAIRNVFHDKAGLKQLEDDILERLVERELLWQQAVRKGMVANEETVAAEMEASKKRYGNEAILNNILKRRNMTRQEFLLLIKRDLTINQLIESEIDRDIAISDEACEQFYQKNLNMFEMPEEIKASHIAVFLREDATEVEQQKAEAAIQAIEHRLKQGEVFEDVARDASQCASGKLGGDLGYFPRGYKDAKFDDVAFSLKIDEVSPIVRSLEGYHIIKVTDKKPAHVVPFAKVKDSIIAHLQAQEVDNRLKAYLAGLRKQADIQYL